MTGPGTVDMLIASAVALAIILILGAVMAAVTWASHHILGAVESWAHRHCWTLRDVTRFPRWAVTRMRRVRLPVDDRPLAPLLDRDEMRALRDVRRAWKMPAAEPSPEARSDERSES